MEAIGQLTAGVAHNFNNMLVGIIGNVQLAQQEAPAALQPLLASADHSAQQAAQMVDQLMAYSRQDMQIPYRSFDIGAALAEVVSFCRRSIDRKISIEINPHPPITFGLRRRGARKTDFYESIAQCARCIREADRANSCNTYRNFSICP